MGDILEFLKYLEVADGANLSVVHVVLAGLITIVLYFITFFFRKFINKVTSSFEPSDFFIKCGVAFLVEIICIWIYGRKIFVFSIVIGIIVALYVRNKFFSFIDSATKTDNDLKVRMELEDLKNKFKKNPYYSILEVLLYYGYISTIQKETVEAENIFKSPDDMAKEFLSKPILTAEQLDEAIGIMNVIRREGKILTREEALLFIMNMNGKNNNPFDKDVSVES